MPFYTLDDMREGAQKGNPTVSVHSAVGEFMKVAVVTKPEGKGPALHEHPNEEQWTLILEGQMHFILGDEDRIVGPGTIVHIPRNVKHRSRPVNGPATFFTVKSPYFRPIHQIQIFRYIDQRVARWQVVPRIAKPPS